MPAPPPAVVADQVSSYVRRSQSDSIPVKWCRIRAIPIKFVAADVGGLPSFPLTFVAMLPSPLGLANGC